MNTPPPWHYPANESAHTYTHIMSHQQSSNEVQTHTSDNKKVRVWIPPDTLSVLTLSSSYGNVFSIRVFKKYLYGLGKKNKKHVKSIWDALGSLAVQPCPGRAEAGAKIVETLTFTRANRAQVMLLEKGIFLSEPCTHTHVCNHVHKCIVVWLGLSSSVGSYIAPGSTVVAAAV